MADEENDLENMSATGSRSSFTIFPTSKYIFLLYFTCKIYSQEASKRWSGMPKGFPQHGDTLLNWNAKMNNTVHLVVFLSITHSYSTGGNFLQEMTFNRTNDFILDSWLFTGQRTFFKTGDYCRTTDIIQEMWLFIGQMTIQDRWLFTVMTFSTTGDFSQDK